MIISDKQGERSIAGMTYLDLWVVDWADVCEFEVKHPTAQRMDAPMFLQGWSELMVHTPTFWRWARTNVECPDHRQPCTSAGACNSHGRIYEKRRIHRINRFHWEWDIRRTFRHVGDQIIYIYLHIYLSNTWMNCTKTYLPAELFSSQSRWPW